MNTSTAFVLDASALMALLNVEPGAEEVNRLALSAAISAVNWCETYGKLRAAGVPADPLGESMYETGIAIVPFDELDARAAGELGPATKHAGLSFADRACLALAARLRVPAVTADRAWSNLDVGVEIVCIR